MKKAARIIIPILLSIAILLGIVWYLFDYDKEFTRDMFLHTARYFQKHGNYKISTWLYDCAYRQAEDKDAVAIELSRQHAKSGNYLQAEKALTTAIADNPSVSLYVALSDIYLEQDKVMDAVNLMDTLCGPDSNINPQIKETLIQMRPAAPTATPVKNSDDPELYESVDFTVSSGTLYINTADSYPSFKNAEHKFDSQKKNVALAEGPNSFYAVAISDEGLVSSVTHYEYELNSNHRRVTEVKFVDPAVEAALRETLQVDDEKVILTSDLWTITSFTVPENAESLDDLYHLIGLKELTIQSAPANQLSILSNTNKLTTLTIKSTILTQEELDVIVSLPYLQKLTLQKCGLTVLDGIEKAVNLRYLDLSGNSIIDIAPIANITGITELYLNENSLSSLEGLSNLTNLKVLNVTNNVLTSLAGITNCQDLQELNVSHNKLTSIDEVVQIYGLAKLNFANNSVSALPQWDKSCGLITIDGSYNKITSLEPLAGLKNLNNVYMDYNPDLESITCLKDCYLLIQVNVYGTKVTDVRVLNDMSVIVKYDPTSN